MVNVKSKKATVPVVQAPEPVLVVEREPDYWSRGHFYEGSKPYIDAMKVWSLPVGTKLYTHPAQLPAVIAQPAVPDLWREFADWCGSNAVVAKGRVYFDDGQEFRRRLHAIRSALRQPTADAGCEIAEDMISRMITRYKELEPPDDVPDVNDPVTRRFCLELLSAALTPEVRHGEPR